MFLTGRRGRQAWHESIYFVIKFGSILGGTGNDQRCTGFIDKDRIPDDLPPYRLWEPLGYCWESPALCHRPLYFEEVNLERYGYTSPRMRLLQPAVSGARFFATVPALPYLINARPPCECVYTLGHYRPGSCVPYRRHWPELRVLPTSVEAAAATGLVFLIP